MKDRYRYYPPLPEIALSTLKPYPAWLQVIVYNSRRYHTRVVEDVIKPDLLENQVMTSFVDLVQNFPNIYLGTPPTKAQALGFLVSFADFHNAPVFTSITNQDAQEWFERFLGHYQPLPNDGTYPKSYELVSAVKILQISLEMRAGDLSLAAVLAAFMSRHLARNQDKRVVDLDVTPNMMRDWQRMCKGFKGLPDPSGDVYHFLSGLLVGVCVPSQPSGWYDQVTIEMTDALMNRVPEITSLLRYKVAGREGVPHATDLLGYRVGRKLRQICNQD